MLYTEAALNAKVKAVNETHRRAMKLYEVLSEFFKPYVGQKILKADGALLAKVSAKFPEMPFQFYRNSSKYSLAYSISVSETIEGSGGSLYYEVSVYIGDLQGDVLEKLYDAPVWRTDYTAEEIAGKRAAVKAAEKLLDEAKTALWPFTERDR